MDKFFQKTITKIKENEHIYIVTHRHMDLDGFGAALGMANILKKYGKKATIIINSEEQESAIQKAMQFLKNNREYHFVESSSIDQKINIDLLLILDVHKKEMLEIPSIVNLAKEIILVDHHIKREESIPCSLDYIIPSASSTVEIMVQFLKEEKVSVDSITATIMLSGIYLDTNGFNIKTTSTTFDAAAYLMNNHADNVKKQEIFQEDMKIILKRQKLLKNSYKINDNMMICILDKSIYKSSDLAKIAEDILRIQDAEASFAIGYISEKTVGISARSIGKINVEKIMKKLGGGGHKTDAATKIENTSLEEVKKQLEEILR